MKKITVAICDDEKEISLMLRKIVSSYYSKHNVLCNIFIYSTGFDFLNENRQYTFDLVLMDINLDVANGLNIINDYRKSSAIPAQVVFITGHEEYKIQALPLHTFDYITKPFTSNEITKLLDDLTMWIESKNEINKVSFKTLDGLISINVNEILYFEYVERKTKIVTNTNSYFMNSTLKDIGIKLKQFYFSSPHSAYLVNLKNIKLLTKDHLLIMINDACIPLAQTKQKKFRAIYIDYLRV